MCGQGWSDDPACLDEAAEINGPDMDWLAGLGGFHDLAVPDVDDDMSHWLIEEEQVARLQLAQADSVTGGGLRCGGARQRDTDLVVDPLHQATAVEATRRVAPVDVGRALLSECGAHRARRCGELDGDLGGRYRRRRSRCSCRSPDGCSARGHNSRAAVGHLQRLV